MYPGREARYWNLDKGHLSANNSPAAWQTWCRRGACVNVCLWHLADIDADDEHVCFWG